jgi:hypothetical protein
VDKAWQRVEHEPNTHDSQTLKGSQDFFLHEANNVGRVAGSLAAPKR